MRRLHRAPSYLRRTYCLQLLASMHAPFAAHFLQQLHSDRKLLIQFIHLLQSRFIFLLLGLHYLHLLTHSLPSLLFQQSPRPSQCPLSQMLNVPRQSPGYQLPSLHPDCASSVIHLHFQLLAYPCLCSHHHSHHLVIPFLPRYSSLSPPSPPPKCPSHISHIYQLQPPSNATRSQQSKRIAVKWFAPSLTFPLPPQEVPEQHDLQICTSMKEARAVLLAYSDQLLQTQYRPHLENSCPPHLPLPCGSCLAPPPHLSVSHCVVPPLK